MKMKFLSLCLALSLMVTPVALTYADDDIQSVVSAKVDELLTRTQDLIFGAMAFISIPYKFGGTSPEMVFDCSGFVQYVFRQATGLLLPRTSYEQFSKGISVAVNDLQPGDLVFFNTTQAKFSHVGIYIGGNRFIHAPRFGKSVEIDNMTDAYWKKRFNGARRIPI